MTTCLPELELIRRLPRERTAHPPLLFVHGAFTGAWCWDEHFLHYFAAQGYPSWAVSLRGHGASSGQEYLIWSSLSDYVDDVCRAIARMPQTPIVIGHSMGGMVVQKLMEQRNLPGAVLMASVPPEGLLYPTLWLSLGDPWLLHQLNLLQWGGPSMVGVEGARRALFSDQLSDDLVARYCMRSQCESQRALLDMSWLDLPRPVRGGETPVLVLGTRDDALIPPSAVQTTARAYGVREHFIDGLGHAMMLDADWRRVAGIVLAWLQEHHL